MARPSRQMPEFPMKDALALACAIFRVQGSVKFSEPFQDATGQYFDASSLAKNVLTDKTTFAVTAEDRNRADAIYDEISGAVTFSLIQGLKINEFTKNVYDLISRETVKLFEIGLLVWAPKIAADMSERQQKRDTIVENGFKTEPLGKVGEKVEIDFTLVRQGYVQALNCYSAMGHDGNGHAVGFLTQHQNLLKSGRIVGKVRKFGADQYNGGVMTTSLNYVKVPK